MSVRYSSGKHTLGVCDRCAEWVKLNSMKYIVIKDNVTAIKVCKRCWEPSHPQLRVGQYPVNDPQAVRDPRPDVRDAETPGALGDSILLQQGTDTQRAYGLRGTFLLQENGSSILLEGLTSVLSEDGSIVVSSLGDVIISG
jgi:hypothetical protein